MAWILLVLAGLLEVAWSIGMKYTDGFTRLVPSVLTGAGIVASMLLLSYAARSLPIGTAYGVWVGIGAAGAAVLGMVVLGEPATAARIVFLGVGLFGGGGGNAAPGESEGG
ncbi:DMT family transporter, partial [Streptomyces sp. NPDC058964]|uniref:DMT family transporter n=1 Tax=Streptomyces sp. NPDC058964 TaxID=3346681 RepID=UPI0036A18477